MTTHIPWTPAEPDLLDQAEAARRLNVSRTTIWRRIKRADIRGVRIGSRTLVPRLELQRTPKDPEQASEPTRPSNLGLIPRGDRSPQGAVVRVWWIFGTSSG